VASLLWLVAKLLQHILYKPPSRDKGVAAIFWIKITYVRHQQSKCSTAVI